MHCGRGLPLTAPPDAAASLSSLMQPSGLHLVPKHRQLAEAIRESPARCHAGTPSIASVHPTICSSCCWRLLDAAAEECPCVLRSRGLMDRSIWGCARTAGMHAAGMRPVCSRQDDLTRPAGLLLEAPRPMLRRAAALRRDAGRLEARRVVERRALPGDAECGPGEDELSRLLLVPLACCTEYPLQLHPSPCWPGSDAAARCAATRS